MAEAGQALFHPLQETVRKNVSHTRAAPVVPAELGQLAGLHGAALLVWERAERTGQAEGGIPASAREQGHFEVGD